MAIRVTRAGVGLAVGIIVLAAVVFGGLWLVKDRGEQARREEAVKIAEQKLSDESSREVAIESQTKQEERTERQSNNGTANQQESQGAQPGATESNQGSTTELPMTGPVENGIVTIIAVAALTFAGASYWRSRRLLLEAK